MDIFEEIKEDLERERFLTLWQRYGYLLLVAIITVIIGTSGSIWWKNKQIERQEIAGNQFEQAIVAAERNELTEALRLFDQLARESKGNAASLALLRAASLERKQGKNNEAIALYDKVAADKNTETALQELALLLKTYVLMETGKEVDTAQLAALAKEDGVWHASARELQALYLLRKGDQKQAKIILSALVKDEETPSAMKERAEEIMSGLE